MNDKTRMAKQKRISQGEKLDLIIWNRGIIPNYAEKDFTCYTLHKILKSLNISYQNLYKHLRKYEKNFLLNSKIIVNDNNRRERRFNLICTMTSKDIQNWFSKKGKKYQKEYITQLPKKIYKHYYEGKSNREEVIQKLKDIAQFGYIEKNFHDFIISPNEVNFIGLCIQMVTRISEKNENLFEYLKEIIIAHEIFDIRMLGYFLVRKYYPEKFEEIKEYILTNEKYLTCYLTPYWDKYYKKEFDFDTLIGKNRRAYKTSKIFY